MKRSILPLRILQRTRRPAGWLSRDGQSERSRLAHDRTRSAHIPPLARAHFICRLTILGVRQYIATCARLYTLRARPVSSHPDRPISRALFMRTLKKGALRGVFDPLQPSKRLDLHPAPLDVATTRRSEKGARSRRHAVGCLFRSLNGRGCRKCCSMKLVKTGRPMHRPSSKDVLSQGTDRKSVV